MNLKTALCVMICTGLSPIASSGDHWTHFPLFNESPLEIKMGPMSDGPDPDLAVFVLWNDETNNRLDVLRVPPPYDGTGATSTALENTSTLFALGDVCTVGNVVFAPYIKDFNVEVARFNGSTWSTSTIPGTTTNNFDNAQCGTTVDGAFVLTHDLTDGETEIFKSTNAGQNYTFYGRYTSSGPFDGAIREPLATSFAGRYAYGLNQQSNGQVRATRFNTNQNPPNFTHTNIQTLPPPAGFTFVKESAASFNGNGVSFTYNANGGASNIDILSSENGTFTFQSLGNINNSGSQYTYQGAGLISIMDAAGDAMKNHVLWGDYFIDDPYSTAPANTDGDYPLAGVGGPVDGCVAENEADFSDFMALVAGPRVGSDGTDMYHRQLTGDPIFSDGFESGDVSAWTVHCD